MKSYWQAIESATESGNMPDPMTRPGLFIPWAEYICQLIADIYDRDYDQVTEDLQEKLVNLNLIQLED